MSVIPKDTKTNTNANGDLETIRINVEKLANMNIALQNGNSKLEKTIQNMQSPQGNASNGSDSKNPNNNTTQSEIIASQSRLIEIMERNQATSERRIKMFQVELELQNNDLKEKKTQIERLKKENQDLEKKNQELQAEITRLESALNNCDAKRTEISNALNKVSSMIESGVVMNRRTMRKAREGKKLDESDYDHSKENN